MQSGVHQAEREEAERSGVYIVALPSAPWENPFAKFPQSVHVAGCRESGDKTGTGSLHGGPVPQMGTISSGDWKRVFATRIQNDLSLQIREQMGRLRTRASACAASPNLVYI